MSQLPIIHFNDAYRVGEQKTSNDAGVIDVTQFAYKVDEMRNSWSKRDDGERDGLVLFSGDLFSPSIESGVTRGSHMVPVMNEISPDVSLIGNHDFDFGYPRLTTLLGDINHPWIISNIVDTNTGKPPTPLQEFYVTERCGVRIGIIGLIEEDWIATISAWPTNFKYKDVKETAEALSKSLRDPTGDYACDLVIALTHARVPNDIRFAEAINALSPSARTSSFAYTHGADLLLGGHDHFYYASKGVTSWENYDINNDVPGAEEDKGTVLVAKSGTDFRDLSEIILDLEDTPEGSVRRKIIKAMRGKRHTIKPGSPSSQKLKAILRKVLDKVSKGMKAPLCVTHDPFDLRSQVIRMGESASGNWFADVFRCAYDDALSRQGLDGVDGVLIGAGSLRGDSVYGPGTITVGEFMEILPYLDAMVVIELDGAKIWGALEAGLSRYPAQEGRFPVISGLLVTWDSRRPPGHRVMSIARRVQKNLASSSDDLTEIEEIKREEGGKKYAIMTVDYMAEGHDGYDCMKGSNYIINDEEGQIMGTLIRSYLLGAQYIKHVQSVASASNIDAEASVASYATVASDGGQGATDEVQSAIRSPSFTSPFMAACSEDMSSVDFFNGKSLRTGLEDDDDDDDLVFAASVQETDDTGLVVISSVLDGRLRDVSRD